MSRECRGGTENPDKPPWRGDCPHKFCRRTDEGLSPWIPADGLTRDCPRGFQHSRGDCPHDAFYGCSGLTSVVIPSSVTSIWTSAFYDCSELTSVHVEKGDAARVRGLLERSWSGLDLDSISFVEDWIRVDETVILPSAVIEAGMAKYPALAALAGADVEAFSSR